jgi:hypothetical protein
MSRRERRTLWERANDCAYKWTGGWDLVLREPWRQSAIKSVWVAGYWAGRRDALRVRRKLKAKDAK